MKSIKFTTPDVKFVRTILKGTGVKIHRCRIINNRLFVTVDSSKKEFIEDCLVDLDLAFPLMNKVISSTFGDRTDFPNLMLRC